MSYDERLQNSAEEQNVLSFRVGDCVVYRAEGICDVTDIRKEKFGVLGEDAEYYILSPRNEPNSLVYIPLHNETLMSLMRPLLNLDEIVALAASLRDERMEWIPESRSRNNRFRELLSVGDRRELIVLIHTIREHIAQGLSVGKKPGSTDTGALKRAAKLLRDEFSMAISLPCDEDLFDLLDGTLSHDRL